MRRSKKLKMGLTLAEAKTIVLGSPTKNLGAPGKMPEYTLGLSAMDCRRGGELANTPGSVCEGCYARKNFYIMPHVQAAHWDRTIGLGHPQWVDAMVILVSRYSDPKDPVFRWHDSGDILSVDHLRNVVRVAELTPEVRHWLPTHEHEMVREFLKSGGTVPSNLCIRLSADMVDESPQFDGELADIPTSSVHTELGFPVQVSDKRNHSIECKAYTRERVR